jgi:hypothetical protein
MQSIFFFIFRFLFFCQSNNVVVTVRMSSANSFLSSTAYHAPNARYSSSQTSSSSSSSFNILSNSVQQQLNDLNSTRSSTSSCSTSHCLSNQCLECTTILSTRPSQSRCNLNSYIDSTSNSSQYDYNIRYINKYFFILVLYKIVHM